MNRYLCILLAALTISCGSPSSRNAQEKDIPGPPHVVGNPKDKHKDENWKEKIMAEKVAFLTKELDLTTEEAQKFWPIYNQCDNEHEVVFDSLGVSYRALEKAIADGSDEATISKMLDAYTDAVIASHSIDAKYIPLYKEVLPAKKVAKLFVGEEKFRRQQIHKLHNKGNK